MECSHRAARLENIYPEDKNASPLQTAEYTLMISMILSPRSALSLNNHECYRMNKNVTRDLLYYLKASAMDVFFLWRVRALILSCSHWKDSQLHRFWLKYVQYGRQIKLLWLVDCVTTGQMTNCVSVIPIFNFCYLRQGVCGIKYR